MNSQPPLPTQISRFEIVARLGGGGMGELYLGRHRGVGGFERYVAIKAIKPSLARHAQFIHMFLDEARIAARIKHENVLSVEEVGQERGLYYLVMDFLPNTTVGDLRGALRELGRRLDPAVAVSIVAAAAAGLHAAHELRDDVGEPMHLVHRDVSPSNILLGIGGEVKVIDFGIAKARGRLHVTLPSFAQAKGKLGYMAPEQLFGRAIDRRADVYALGVVLWELLTMERLYERREVVKGPQPIPPRPGSRVEISAALDQLVMRCLAESPDVRPASAWELRGALRAVVPESREVDALTRAHLVDDVLGEQLRRRLAALGVHHRPSLPGELSPGKALSDWTHPDLTGLFGDETVAQGSIADFAGDAGLPELPPLPRTRVPPSAGRPRIETRPIEMPSGRRSALPTVSLRPEGSARDEDDEPLSNSTLLEAPSLQLLERSARGGGEFEDASTLDDRELFEDVTVRGHAVLEPDED